MTRADTQEHTRLGLLGGTFDPPHVGHLVAAVWARAALGLDEVWLTVANEPWQKVGARAITPAADRLAMVRALVDGVAGVCASDVEIVRGGSSYTADTIAQLAAADPARELFVLVGSDVAANLATWSRADEVRQGATMVLVERPGQSAPALPPGWAFTRVEIPRLDLSSTDLRDRLAAGLPVDGAIPPGVGSVITARGLYRGADL